MHLEEFKKSWSFLTKSTIYVGCSGGVDSIVLLHLLRSIGASVHVIHVNYSLRGNDSEEDEHFVRALCASLGVPIFVKKVDTKALLAEQGGNLQELARSIRYAIFEEKLASNPTSFVALGHHSDDQVETFFQHLARKSGVLGMACMLPSNNRYVRPLLTYSKEEIKLYAIQNHIVWREDLSNAGYAYTRNRLRNILIPTMYAHIPDLKESILTLVQAFQDTQRETEQKAELAYRLIHQRQFWDFTSFDMLSEAECLEVIRLFGGDYDVLLQLKQIRFAQKGKRVICKDVLIYREETGFSFVGSSSRIKYTLHVEEVSHLPSVFSKEIVYLDADKLQGELVLRYWEIGDRISPIGMKGSKLISDILTEHKVMTSLRATSLVVVDQQTVLWCVGHKVSRKAIADNYSKKILKLEVFPV